MPRGWTQRAHLLRPLFVMHEELEKKYWTAIKDGDSAAAASLSDDFCIVVGAQGVGELDRKTLAGMFAGGPWKLNEFDLQKVHVRQVTDDVVIVAYEVNEKLTVEGKPLALKAYDASVWVRRGGGWVCALHTESVAGDPFGRR